MHPLLRTRYPVHVLLVATCVALLALLAPAVASAHALLEGTSPGTGETVQDAPARVTLTFSEHVGLELGGIKVYGPDGKRVDRGGSTSKDATISSRVRAEAPGTYAVSWRVISADGHPIRGAFLFSVQRESDGTAIDMARAASKGSRTLDIAFGIARGAYLLGLLAAAGGVLFGAWIAPGARLRWIGWALLLTIVGSVAGFLLDAAIAGGYGLSETLDVDVLRAQAGSVYGRAGLIRIALAVALAVAVALRSRGRAAVHVAGVVAVALAAAQSLSGHAVAAEHEWIRLPLDMLHAVAAAAWIGGLVQLAAWRSGDPPTHAVVRRYSAVALASVVVLVLTGIYAAWDEIGFSWDGLLDTTYGRLVLAKSALLVATMPLANRNRTRHVPALAGGDDDATPAAEAWPRLRRYVRGELVLLVLIIAATAWLVQSVPARNQVAPPFRDGTVKLASGGTMNFTLDPARAGRNKVHLYVFDKQGAQDDAITQLKLDAVLASPAIGPLEFTGRSTGPGHYSFDDVRLPYAGTWRFTAHIEHKFDEDVARFRAEVAAGKDGAKPSSDENFGASG